MVRKNRWLLVLALAGVAALTASGYAFRSKLAAVPVIGAWFAPVAAESDIAYWTCPMHPEVHEDGPGACPICGMELQPVAAADAAPDQSEPPAVAPPEASTESAAGGARAGVQMDARRRQLIGVRTARAERTNLMRTIRAVGTVRYDETRLADVNLKIEGWIDQLFVDYTGRFVKQGEPLFTLYSPELVATQNEYLLALKTRDRLRQSQIPDAREYAERLVEGARQRLELWDLPPDQLQQLDEGREAQRTVVFRSPIDGFVVEKQALKGQHVTPGMTLYRLADLSVVWVEADLYEQEIGTVGVGQRTTVTIDAYPGEEFRGRVTYIYPYVEERTRTIKVRFELPNRGGRLKPGMFANINLETPIGTGVVIPTNALLDSGTQRIVFVAQGDGYFEPRAVKVGQRLSDTVQILEGVEEGELVATGATFFIDSESQLRAALQGFRAAPQEAAPADAQQRLDITFRSQPDPPRSGDNTFEVEVRDRTGQPVPDAQVSVVFYMPPMPTMNMPAMRSEAGLAPVGGGRYRGAGQVLMGGRWDVTVTVSREGQVIGSQTFAVVAR